MKIYKIQFANKNSSLINHFEFSLADSCSRIKLLLVPEELIPSRRKREGNTLALQKRFFLQKHKK